MITSSTPLLDRRGQQSAGIKRSPVQSPDRCTRASCGSAKSPQEADRYPQPKNRECVMTNRVDATTSTDLNGLAEVIEGIGIAIMGALCGLFVAAMVAKADIEAINSLGALFSAMLYGSVGFYLRTNIPSLSPNHALSDRGSGPKAKPIALASGIGTFVAALAGRESGYMIIFDEGPAA